MNFLLLLAAVIVEFTVRGVGARRSTAWCVTWAQWIDRQCRDLSWWRGWPAALVVLGLPAVATVLVFAVLFSFGHALGHAASLVWLVWLLGPADLLREIEEYRQSLVRGDEPRDADRSAFSVTVEGVELGPPEDDAQFAAARAELAALALSAERGWYAPLFWFFLCGPLGVVVYRLCATLERTPVLHADTAQAIRGVHELFAFLPARITALNLGIAGTLGPVLEELATFSTLIFGRSAAVVARAALAAVDHGRVAADGADPHLARLDQMQALVRRALNVWLVEMAIAAVVL